MHLDLRRLVDPHYPIVVEIALLNAASCDRDLAVERRRQPENQATLELRGDRVWIDGCAAVHHAHDLSHGDRAIAVDLDFRDRSEKGSERALCCDAATGALRQRLAPTGLLRGEIEASREPRRLAKLSASETDRVIGRLMGELIDETLDNENIVTRADAAPEAGGNGLRLVSHILDAHVRRIRRESRSRRRQRQDRAR